MRNIEIADGRFFPNGIKPSLTNVHQSNLKILPLLIKGGTLGQILIKSSDLDYDVEWGNFSSIFNVRNGLTLTGINIEWGGLLIQDTSIDGDGFNLTFTSINILDILANVTSLEANIALDVISPSLAITADTNLFLLTPKVIAGSANNLELLTLIDANTGETDYYPLKYIQTFVIGDWVAQKITILESTHNKGTSPLVQIFSGSTDFILLSPEGGTPLNEVKILSNGNIEILTLAGLEFNGKIIII